MYALEWDVISITIRGIRANALKTSISEGDGPRFELQCLSLSNYVALEYIISTADKRYKIQYSRHHDSSPKISNMVHIPLEYMMF